MKANNIHSFDEVISFECESFNDPRGFFYEAFNLKTFAKNISEQVNFVQDNVSFSKKGVVRGLHFQKKPYEQSKLVSVIHGEIFDVAVDIRTNSPSFGKYCSYIINDKKRNFLWIPAGFAHGFQVLSDHATVIYKVDNFYNQDNEVSIKYDDPIINIQWPLDMKILSDKDNSGLFLRNLR